MREVKIGLFLGAGASVPYGKPTTQVLKDELLDAAQSVQGYFGFDRSVYGDKRNTTPRKWKVKPTAAGL